MILYDFIHGYQPFSYTDPPDWVLSNLKDVYLPTSEVFKNGNIKRMVQLQGWTVLSWLKSPEPIPSLAKKVLDNLKVAHDKGFISIGASAYAHPILPLLSEKLQETQIRIDVDTVTEHIAPPEWFFFPEGAVDGKCLEILHRFYPGLISLIPDSAIRKRNFSGFVKFTSSEGKVIKAVVFNTLLKDIFMNAHHFEARPSYITERVFWDKAKTITTLSNNFRGLLKELSPQSSFHILARDWENCGSRRGLTDYKGGKEIKAFIKEDPLKPYIDFKTLKDVDFKGVRLLNITDIAATSWEPTATSDEPYPFWQPRNPSEGKAKISSLWHKLIHHADQALQEVLREGDVGDEQIAEALPVFISDFPWHFFARKESHPNPGFSEKLLKDVIEVAVEKLILKKTQMVYTVEKGELKKLISELKQEVWDYTVKEFKI